MPSAFSSDITGETGAAPVSPVTDLSSWILLSSLRQKIQERGPPGERRPCCGRRSCHAVVVRDFCACLFVALQMFAPPAFLPPCAFAFLPPTVALRKRRDLRFFLKRVNFFCGRYLQTVKNVLSYQINGKPRKKAGAGGAKDGLLSFRKAKVRKTRSPFAMRASVLSRPPKEGCLQGKSCGGRSLAAFRAKFSFLTVTADRRGAAAGREFCRVGTISYNK